MVVVRNHRRRTACSPADSVPSSILSIGLRNAKDATHEDATHGVLYLWRTPAVQ